MSQKTKKDELIKTLIRYAESGENIKVEQLLQSCVNNETKKENSSCYPPVEEIINGEATTNLSPNGIIVGGTALIWACRWGHGETIQTLVNAGVNVEATDYFGRTAIRHAATMGHADVVRYLLQHGANPNNKDCKGWSVLAKAIEKGHWGVVRVLMADPRIDEKNVKACRRKYGNRIDVMRLLQ